ncbi:hypothetical protein OfM1_00060 [Lactovum odontotermitis]
MRILHYGLGYPPERTGGLIQYVMDLLSEQVNQKHEVAYLFPGRLDFFNSSVRIKQNVPRIDGVASFEIINSLPLAVFGGIKEPEKFLRSVDCSVYENLLNEFKPDIIHIHSLMGIHKEFFEAASEKRIKIVYTTHDYFGLSPNPTFYFNNKSWDKENTLNYWLNVSQGAMSTKKLKVVQLSFYAKLRDKIKKFKRSSFQKESYYFLKNNEDFSSETRKDFKDLREYYQSIFNLINVFHFSSNTAKQVFERNISKPISGEVINITNSTILGGKRQIVLDMSKIKKITYIGQYASFKGFYDFIVLAENCADKSMQFEIYGENIDVPLPANVVNKKRFSSGGRDKVFKNLQLLIIPSRWKETFGFLELEALSYQCPVFVSDNVGSKELIPESFVFEEGKLVTFVNNAIALTKKGTFEVRLPTFQEHAFALNKLYEKA